MLHGRLGSVGIFDESEVLNILLVCDYSAKPLTFVKIGPGGVPAGIRVRVADCNGNNRSPVQSLVRKLTQNLEVIHQKCVHMRVVVGAVAVQAVCSALFVELQTLGTRPAACVEQCWRSGLNGDTFNKYSSSVGWMLGKIVGTGKADKAWNVNNELPDFKS